MSTVKLNGNIINETEAVKKERLKLRDDNIYFFWTLEKLYEYYDKFKDEEDSGAGQVVQQVYPIEE